ncbi:MAG: 7-cyano-7-deazaguanine synthase QueC [Myxococcota bacterium]|nr:7-cyano-7-deazaguanine synthase QueC [Myxococcota bacterium]
MAKTAIVLVSGGLDSTTCLAVARAKGFDVVALSFDYGQRHQVELDAARRVADHYGAQHHYVTALGLFRDLGGSALTGSLAVPKHETAADIGDGIPVTYVPARNLVFLSLAVGVAEVHESTDIFIGVNALDYSGYPDCRPEFIRAFEASANLATKIGVEGRPLTLHMPLVDLTKAGIIQLGHSLHAPYHLTHSCYAPVDGVACGHCDSCLLRLKGFAEAGQVDPIQYAGAKT